MYEKFNPADAVPFFRRNFVPLTPANLTALSGQRAIEPKTLANIVKENADKIYRNIHSIGKVSLPDQSQDDAERLYQLYLATRSIPQTSPLYEIAQTLDSYEAYTANHLQINSVRALNNFLEYTRSFLGSRTATYGIVDVFDSKHHAAHLNANYVYQGDWVNIPRYKGDISGRYVRRAILQEALAVEDLPETELFHASGSAALEGISRQKAILNAYEALLKGEEIKTGEHPYSKPSQGRGLNSVYTSNYVMDVYSVTRWFDEFSVVFGLSINTARECLHKDFGIKRDNLRNFDGEGIVVGKRVPLDKIGSIHTPAFYLDKIRDWARTNCPGARVISLETMELIAQQNGNHDSSRIPFNIEEYSKREGVVLT